MFLIPGYEKQKLLYPEPDDNWAAPQHTGV